jgi:hypothetical protein
VSRWRPRSPARRTSRTPSSRSFWRPGGSACRPPCPPRGAEIIHQHPAADGAAIGDTSHRDFRRLAASIERLDAGGVVLNVGSAVIMPEVFLKALTVARNLNGGKPQGFVTCDLDMQRHYRPRVNVVKRPTQDSGAGYEITGHHELMVPLLAWAVVDELDRG